jgi:hypothetical protein
LDAITAGGPAATTSTREAIFWLAERRAAIATHAPTVVARLFGLYDSVAAVLFPAAHATSISIVEVPIVTALLELDDAIATAWRFAGFRAGFDGAEGRAGVAGFVAVEDAVTAGEQLAVTSTVVGEHVAVLRAVVALLADLDDAVAAAWGLADRRAAVFFVEVPVVALLPHLLHAITTGGQGAHVRAAIVIDAVAVVTGFTCLHLTIATDGQEAVVRAVVVRVTVAVVALLLAIDDEVSAGG